MANFITSVPSIETEEYDLFIKPILDDPNIQALPFDFVFGNMARDIFFDADLDRVLTEKLGCGFTNADGIEFTKKTLDPVEVGGQIPQCYSVLLKKLFGNNLPDGAMRGDLTQVPQVADYMTSRFNAAVNRDLLAMLFLGDTNLTESVKYYSVIDGIYAKLKAGAAANDGTIDAGVTLNATTLNTTNFFTTMNNVWKKQSLSRRLKNTPAQNKAWIWTQALYDLYTEYLEASTQGTAGITQIEHVVNGVNATTFKSIPIIVVPFVDDKLIADFTDNSGEPVDPYRCILTVPTNHKILMDGSAFQNSDLFYEKLEDQVYIRASALIDYQYGYGEFNLFAGLS